MANVLFLFNNGHYFSDCQFTLMFYFSLLFLLGMPTATTAFLFNNSEFFQYGLYTPLKKMEITGGSDLGCRHWSDFQDFNGEMGLEAFTSDKMNPQRCLDYCRIKGFKFSVVSEGRKCSCGFGSKSLQRVSEQYHCNLPCAADKEYRCGGSNGYFQLFSIITPTGKVDVNSVYLGCYEEEENPIDENSRPLPELFSDTIHMTITRCIISCHSRFRKYAALQQGTQCWCGDHLSVPHLLDRVSNSSQCNVPCINKAKTCGGEKHTQIYAITYAVQRETPLAMYMGCFSFVAEAESDLDNVMYNYALNKLKKNMAGAMSISRCCYLCTVKKKPFAGLYQGDTCYCSIVLNPRREKHLHDDNDCNRPCTESKAFFCGGDQTMQVYNLRPLGLGKISDLI